jgi:hypothetical protein
MPRQDELAGRRFAKLVGQIKAMMSAGLKPEYRGLYGQLVLARDAVTELSDAAEVRRAARAAGRRLRWQVRTHVTDEGTLAIIDDRDPAQEIRERAARRSAEAVSAVIARAQAEARQLRTSAPSPLPTRPPGLPALGRISERPDAGPTHAAAIRSPPRSLGSGPPLDASLTRDFRCHRIIAGQGRLLGAMPWIAPSCFSTGATPVSQRFRRSSMVSERDRKLG